MAEAAVDANEFLKQLKAKHAVLPWEPLAPVATRNAPEPERSRSKESLDYLHRHWALPDQPDTAHAGGGARGRLMRMFGAMTFRVLGPYLREEREVVAHLVRVADALDRRCDELSSRCRELAEAATERQATEAANLIELAAWLHAREQVGEAHPDRTFPAGLPTGPEDQAPAPR